uniref:Uncharacterized protein n=1 Tax=Leersia perrieri TaxID=77586 RepID=A0A0D9VBY0_9ORYZ
MTPDCEEDTPRATCKILCFICCVLNPNHSCTQGRSSSSAAAAVFAGDGSRKIGVSPSISGVDAATGESEGPTDGDAADCVHGCKKN